MLCAIKYSLFRHFVQGRIGTLARLGTATGMSKKMAQERHSANLLGQQVTMTQPESDEENVQYLMIDDGKRNGKHREERMSNAFRQRTAALDTESWAKIFWKNFKFFGGEHEKSPRKDQSWISSVVFSPWMIECSRVEYKSNIDEPLACDGTKYYLCIRRMRR